MNNGYIHDKVLLHLVDQAFRTLPVHVFREYPVFVRERRGFIDRIVDHNAGRLAIEAETTARRVDWARDKALAANASGLALMVPTYWLAGVCLKKLREADDQRGSALWISVLTPGRWGQWFRLNFALFSASFEDSKIIPRLSGPGNLSSTKSTKI